ncbi:hypothetical protein WR25_21372 [Diploscapter pachys]|uniref:Coenzyme PQQ synthesis protein F-like C-terminal lobe domain-containing protein n=1 Tax=Diploscapter pachys TaxID=2018661 RepID=A0A2A2JJ68_9BILA|nr:hypothetical protein WR25_21372 [Diploscapter pachys]
MVQLMKETAFNTLRTNEQLGYTIWTSSRMHNGTLGLDVIVQGPKDPDPVLSRIENFIETFQAKLKSMGEAEFNEHKEALICCLLEKPKTLNTRNDRIWNEIDCQQYDFEKNEDEATFLKTITKDQVLDYYNRKLVKGAQERRVVACLVHPKGSDEAMTRRKREAKEENCHSRQEVDNVEDLRSMLPLFGRPKPKIQLRQIGADIFCKGDKCEQNANLDSKKAENDIRAKY